MFTLDIWLARSLRTPQRDAPRTWLRGGFSLLEVSIALLLGMFLMLAVFQSFFVAARYRFTADVHLRGLALNNAVRDLSGDLMAITIDRRPLLVEAERDRLKVRSALLPQRGSGRDARDPSTTGLEVRRVLLPQQMSFHDAFALTPRLQWTQFTGKANYIALRTLAWSSRFTRLPADVAEAGECLVVWWQYEGTACRVEGWRDGALPVSRVLKVPPNASGLIRTQFFMNRQGIEQERAEVIFPEVVRVQLRYFDGRELRESWDTDIEHQVPAAVQARLRIGNEEIERWFDIPTQ